MPQPMPSPLRAIWGVVLLGGLLPGCGPSGVKLHPVRGQVLFEGKPAAGATVVLHSATATDPNAPKPAGTVGADGSFALHTYPLGEGAPAGEYVVLVTWYPANAREMENPVNRLPARYADPTASRLRATVQDGPTDLEPYRLTK